jgi:hypothetical protein
LNLISATLFTAEEDKGLGDTTTDNAETCKLFEYFGIFSAANILGFLTYQLPDSRSSYVLDHCSHMLTFILYLLIELKNSTVL